MSYEIFPRITVNPDVCLGKPTIRGSRIRVSDVLDLLASGEPSGAVIESYPFLNEEDIRAALSYAARSVDRAMAWSAAAE